ncbi:uncharacterized protein B4U79_08372, partial [Dinothrombium tinctorium]
MPKTISRVTVKPIEISFSCRDRVDGIYADTLFSCQLYHACKTEIHSSPRKMISKYSQFINLCPTGSRFDQKQLKCVDEKDALIPCSESVNYYPSAHRTQLLSLPISSEQLIPVECPSGFQGAFTCKVKQNFLIYEKVQPPQLTGGLLKETTSPNKPAPLTPSNHQLVPSPENIGNVQGTVSQHSKSEHHQISSQNEDKNTHLGSVSPVAVIATGGSEQILTQNRMNTNQFQPSISEDIGADIQPSLTRVSPPFNPFPGLPVNVEKMIGRLDTSFTCKGKAYGYYADVRNGCKIYHVCKEQKHPFEKSYLHFSFLCNPGTIFDQKFLTCVKPNEAAIACRDSEIYFPKTSAIFAEKDNQRNTQFLNANRSTPIIKPELNIPSGHVATRENIESRPQQSINEDSSKGIQPQIVQKIEAA